VTRQVVPKPDTIQLDIEGPDRDASVADVGERPDGPPTDRMLAAVMRRGDTAWFIKGVAPLSQVDQAVGDQFDRLVRSIAFADETGNPTWDLPAGWSQSDGSGGMRFATLRTGGIEFSVIPLPAGGDWQAYLLANLNRWRGQLALPSVEMSEMTESARQVSLADGTQATLVDLRGWNNADAAAPRARGRGGSFQAGAGNGAGRATAPAPITQTPQASRPSPTLKYETPRGWQTAPAGQISSAAFQVEDGQQRVEVTATALGGAAGGLLANVNRWRGQVGLPPAASVRDIGGEEMVIADQPATYVRLEGPGGQTILAAVVVSGERSWFFKLAGNQDLALREEDRFRQFLMSVELPRPPD
jgi:hypothetical protein